MIVLIMPPSRLAIGAIVMAACNGMKIGLQLIVTPTVAHLLGPKSFGLYSLALPAVVFVMMLADAGLGQSLERESEERTEVWSSAFWLLLASGIILAIALSLWSIPLAALAHQPGLPRIMVPLSLSVVLLTLAVCPYARLTRQGRIETFSLIDLMANGLGAGVAIGLALAGAGVWSLVGQFLTIYGVRALVANVVSPRRPDFVFDWRAVAPHTLLGGSIVATKFVDNFGRMAESAIVSRRFGPSHLGMYAFANQAAWSLVQAVNNPTGTMLYVNTLNTPDSGAARVLYLRLLRVTAMTTLPVTMIIAGAGPLLVSAVLGPAWGSAILLIAMIFPSQALATLGQLAGAVLYAQGRSRGQVWLSLINAALRLGAVLSYFGGWPAVAIAMAVANVASFGFGLLNARIQLGWSLTGALAVVRGPLLAAIPAGLGTYLLGPRLGGRGLVELGVAMTAGAALYAVLLALLDQDLLKADIGALRAWRVSAAGRAAPA